MTERGISTMLWQDGCLHEIRREFEGRMITLWIPCESYRAVERQLTAPDAQISVVPRQDKQSWTTGRAPVVWATLQTGDARAALERFRPAPTVVLRAGRTQLRWALWALSVPLWGSYIEQATERLAYALHGLRRAASVETLIPSPFTVLDRRRIYVEFEEPEIYSARQVVGHLRDAPPPYDWRKRRRRHELRGRDTHLQALREAASDRHFPLTHVASCSQAGLPLVQGAPAASGAGAGTSTGGRAPSAMSCAGARRRSVTLSARGIACEVCQAEVTRKRCTQWARMKRASDPRLPQARE